MTYMHVYPYYKKFKFAKIIIDSQVYLLGKFTPLGDYSFRLLLQLAAGGCLEHALNVLINLLLLQ